MSAAEMDEIIVAVCRECDTDIRKLFVSSSTCTIAAFRRTFSFRYLNDKGATMHAPRIALRTCGNGSFSYQTETKPKTVKGEAVDICLARALAQPIRCQKRVFFALSISIAPSSCVCATAIHHSHVYGQPQSVISPRHRSLLFTVPSRISKHANLC